MRKPIAALAACGLITMATATISAASPPNISFLLLSTHQVGVTVPAKSIGGTKWVRLPYPLKVDKKRERAITAAVFLPKLGKTTTNLIQVVAWDKSSAIAYRQWLTWHESALAEQTMPHASIFNIPHMGQGAAGFQIQDQAYDLRFVDGPILERVIYHAHKSISRQKMIALARQAYRVEHGHHRA